MPDIGAYLWPDSVAIIGASEDTKGIRGRLTSVVSQHDYKGDVYYVSRSSDEIFGKRAYKSILDLDGKVDLALIAVPAQFVVGEVANCIKAGVKAIQIHSSGFAEAADPQGAAWQEELVKMAKEADIALAGPNCQGFANTGNNLFATFSRPFDKPDYTILPNFARKAGLAIVSQSGGIGNSFFHYARVKQIPSSYVCTTGNEAGMEMFDIVESILDRGDACAVLVFMEDIKNARTFCRAADKAVRASIPIIVVKIGKSSAGQRAAASHTAALAGDYAGFQAIFRKYGVIEVSDIGEMTDIAQGFYHFGKMLPKGKRVGIVTGSGGGGGLMADSAELAGLTVPELDTETRARLEEEIPDYGTSQNPVDATATALRTMGFSGLIERTEPSPEIDVIVGVASTRITGSFDVDYDNLKRVGASLKKPVFFWSYNVPSEASYELLSDFGFPLYSDIRNCARTINVMANYNAFRERYIAANAAPETVEGDANAAETALASAGKMLTEADSRPILAHYGLCESEVHLATCVDEAKAAFEKISGAVALKVQSTDIIHKSDAGTLALNLTSADAVAVAYDKVLGSAKAYKVDADIQGVLVQPMAPKGVEMILGITPDDKFGPMLMVGLGGIFVEILKDVAFAPAPLNRTEAAKLLQRLRGYPLLKGARGEPVADVEALIDVMVRLSTFAAEQKNSVAEIDLNPVIVHPEGQGVSIADALIVKHGG